MSLRRSALKALVNASKVSTTEMMATNAAPSSSFVLSRLFSSGSGIKYAANPAPVEDNESSYGKLRDHGTYFEFHSANFAADRPG